MSLSTIIILLTFSIAIIEKFLSKKPEDRTGFLKKLKLENFAILLLGFLLLLQIFNNLNESEEKQLSDNQRSETLTHVKETKEILDTNLEDLICDLESLNDEISDVKSRIAEINELSMGIGRLQDGIKKSKDEFMRLNRNYENQLKLEKEKINEDKPILEVGTVKVVIDSLDFSYRYQFINIGNRIADSIRHTSIMVFSDSLGAIKEHVLCKSNRDDLNGISIDSKNFRRLTFTSSKIPFKSIENYKFGFLLIKYEFKDNWANKWIISDQKIFRCESFENNSDMYLNVLKKNGEVINNYLRKNGIKLDQSCN